jgi:hypothetical protein
MVNYIMVNETICVEPYNLRYLRTYFKSTKNHCIINHLLVAVCYNNPNEPKILCIGIIPHTSFLSNATRVSSTVL